jgi:mitochondrial fission protein ELM1
MKLFLIGLLSVLNAHFILGSVKDIPTDLKGDQCMIQSLRELIDVNVHLKTEDISIGAGLSGALAFKNNCAKIQLLLVWQWLDALNDLSKNTIVVVPKHAIDERFNNIKTIQIEGVLHNRTLENIQTEDHLKIFENPELIIMLAGDTQQEDGSWKPFKAEYLNDFMKNLPHHKKILFLNGPRTGKFKLELQNELLEDKEAHRTKTDYITEIVQEWAKENKLCTVIDFKFGATSFWGAALKYCVMNKNTTLVLPGESTSMISEALALGIKPVIYVHPAMTVTSFRYIEDLLKNKKIIEYPCFTEINYQDPLPKQEKIIMDDLVKLLKENKQ